MEERHHLNADILEQGKLTLDEYLDRVVFHTPRSFSRDEFRRFMFQQSRPYPEMIELIARLRAHHGLKVAVVSNEGRELNEYRIREFRLTRIAEAFICSAAVHLRKPDVEIFRLALDVVQTPPEKVVFLDNTPMHVEVAKGLGIRGIVHKDYGSTCEELASLGLATEEGTVDASK